MFIRTVITRITQTDRQKNHDETVRRAEDVERKPLCGGVCWYAARIAMLLFLLYLIVRLQP